MGRGARGLGRFVTEQPPYSILVRGIEADVLPTAEKYGMGVIPWSPLAGGWLTGRYRKGQDVPASHRAQRLPGRYDLSNPGNRPSWRPPKSSLCSLRTPGSRSFISPWPSRSRIQPSPHR